jgi:hypothetical protein
MYLPTAAQNDTAALIAKWVRENTVGYAAIATEVGRAGHPDAAVVAITKNGSTTCTAKVAVYPNRIVYASKLGGRVSYPTTLKGTGQIIGSFLSLEEE